MTNHRSFHTVLFFTALATLSLYDAQAFAQGGQAWTGTGETVASAAAQTKQLAEQISTLPKTLAVGAYVIGTFFGVKGLIALRDWMVDAERNPLGKSLGFIIASALLIVLPHMIGVIQRSTTDINYKIDPLAKSWQEATDFTGTNGKKTFEDPGDTNNFREAQFKMVDSVVSVPKVIVVLAYICGTFFAASGLMKLKDWVNDGERNPLNPALFRLLTAALLVSFPHVLLVVTGSLFGRGDPNSAAFAVDVNVNTEMGKLTPFNRLK
jgi:hypothetical protein